jgi:predicted transcriptional regulator
MAKKFTVEFADVMAEKLDSLATRKGVSKVDVLRRALTLYDYAEKETGKDPDKKLSITKGDKKLQDIILP